jgi:hypothetical protein
MASEGTPDALDALVRRLGGSVQRYTATEVHEALDAARKAEAAARAAARTTLSTAKPEAAHTRWGDVKASIKKLFSGAH